MMRNFFLALLLMFVFTEVANAQIRGRDQQQQDDEYFSTDQRRGGSRLADSPLWFGAGAQLGFSSNRFSNFFQIGISPIVGYKLNNFLSVGPRASISYNNIGYNGALDNENWFEWSAGLFTRAKVFRGFFVHGEYSLLSEQQRLLSGELERITRAIPYLGAGFSQGGGPGATGFEIMLLFRLSSADRLGDAPYDIRTGLNYNF